MTNCLRGMWHFWRMRTFLTDSDGATAIEYCFLAALLALAVIGSAEHVGKSLGGFFDTLGEATAMAGMESP